MHFAKCPQGLARSLHTVILHLAQNNHALFLIQFVDIELVAPIFPMEYHIQNAAHMPRPHIVVGVDIAILGRFHMGTEDLVHINPTRQVEIEDAIYLLNLTLESNLFRK